MTEREDKPRRFRNAREYARVGSLEKRIEDDYGLPSGSISIRNSDGSNTRSDKKIGNLKKEHENK